MSVPTTTDSDDQQRAPINTTAPGLVAECARAGQWLFRRRGYVPLLLVAYLLGRTALGPAVAGRDGWMPIWIGFGLLLGALGLGIRAFSLAFVPSGTSGRDTREMRADTLNTMDFYSLVRHPLYLGNLLLWIGTSAFVGQPTVLVITGLIFWVYYERIMIAEESFLHRRFGEEFEEWADCTPALFPDARSAWRRSEYPFNLKWALVRDSQAWFAFVVTTFSIQCVRLLVQGEPGQLSPSWWGYLLMGTGVYLALRGLKRRNRRRRTGNL